MPKILIQPACDQALGGLLPAYEKPKAWRKALNGNTARYLPKANTGKLYRTNSLASLAGKKNKSKEKWEGEGEVGHRAERDREKQREKGDGAETRERTREEARV